jgi:uncharacterized RDD family membrane protein YckC
MEDINSEAQPSPAGFWVRGGALLIDTSILMTFSLLPLPISLIFIAGLAYRTIFISRIGQTPGKMAAGIKVIGITGEPIGMGRALARAVSEYLSGLALSLGYLPAAFSGKRALHDYITATRVVYVDGITERRKALFAGLGALTIVLILGSFAVGLKASGAVDSFKLLMVKRAEGRTLHNLASLRIALENYSRNNEGRHPATLEGLIDPRYLPALPPIEVRTHGKSNAWMAYGAEVCAGEDIDDAKLKDTGSWGYVADPRAKCAGFVFIDCTHPDSRGKYLTRR